MNNYNIYIDGLENIDKKECFLSIDDKLYLSKIKHQNAYKQTATGRFLLRKYLKTLKGNIYKDYKIKYLNGKPFIPELPSLHFNLSHSNDLVALIISDNHCGIDIQHINDYRENVAKKYFHQKEYNYLKQLKGTEKLNEFYKIWTYKEAYYKMCGTGINSEMNKIYLDDKNVLFNDDIEIKNIFIKSELLKFKGTNYYKTICIKTS